MGRYNEREYRDVIDASSFHKDSGKIDNEESDKYEIEFEETIDRWHHSLLGEKLDENGIWVRDPNIIRIINAKGAENIIRAIRSAINKNMNFARFDDQEKRIIEADYCISLAPLIFGNYEEFEIPYPAQDYCNTLGIEVFNQYKILLSIARDGNMIQYRGDKTKTIISRHETPNVNQGAY